MRYLNRLLLVLASLLPSVASADEGASGDKWITLFDGSNLEHWTMGKDESWVVQDGTITLQREFDGKEHNNDYLWTKLPWDDFVLELEFKVPERANSGVFLRTSDRGDPVYSGLELQVTNSYGRKELSRTGTVGALYGLKAPSIDAAKPAGEWNRYRITCQGPTVTVELNGKRVNQADLDNWTQPNQNPDGSTNKFPTAIKDFARRGYIGLQDHGRQVWYRNVRVKPLQQDSAHSNANTSFRFVDNSHGKKLLTPDGRHLLSYMTRKPADSELAANSVCCLFPVNTPQGQRMVDFAPSDHPHHRGIFLAWHAIDGPKPADFWGWGQWAPTDDRVIVNRRFTPGRADSGGASFNVDNEWMVENEVFIDEHSVFEATETEDCFLIDAEYRLKPRVDLTLRQTAFGGFCVKARKDGERKYLSADGRVSLPDPHHLKPKTNWPARDWYAFEIALESGKTIGIAVVDHPENPASLWHNLKPISMINPCIAAPAEYKMPAAETLTLRYRMLVYDGKTPVDSIKRLAKDYRSATH